MSECNKSGHFHLQTFCKDCGRILNEHNFDDETGACIKVTSRWISVKDRLPEDEKRVLAYGRAACMSCSKHLQIQFCKYQKETGFEFGEYDCEFDATHWQPLPEPPNE
jgi:hypothetical protein